MADKKPNDKESLVKKQVRVEKVTNIIMAVILLVCVAAVIYMIGASAGAFKKDGASANSGSTATGETAQAVEPGEPSTETLTVNDVEYTVTVPGTLDFSKYTDEAYLTENGRYTIDFSKYIENDVELPEFTGTKDKYVASDEDVTNAINELLNSYAVFTEFDDQTQPIKEGNTVKVSYTTSYNGVNIPTVTDTDAEVVIGSHNYIEGFEEALVGHKSGDVFTCDITFPTTYTTDGTETGEPAVVQDDEGNDVTLTGNTITFEFTVGMVGETVAPELTDEWVKTNVGDTSGIPVDTVALLEDYYRTYLYYNALISDVNTYVVDTVMPQIKFSGIPQELFDYVSYSGLYQYNSYGESMGTDLDTTVYNMTGFNVHDYLVENAESIAEQCLQLMAWDYVYGKCLEQGAVDVADENNLKNIMSEVMCYTVDDEEFNELVETSGRAYTANYATQYSIADFLVK